MLTKIASNAAGRHKVRLEESAIAGTRLSGGLQI
jgi:hypothetical protein